MSKAMILLSSVLSFTLSSAARAQTYEDANVRVVAGAAKTGEDKSSTYGAMASIPVKRIGKSGAALGLGVGVIHARAESAAGPLGGRFAPDPVPFVDKIGDYVQTAEPGVEYWEGITRSGIDQLAAAAKTVHTWRLGDVHVTSARWNRMRAEAGVGVGIASGAPGYELKRVKRLTQTQKQYFTYNRGTGEVVRLGTDPARPVDVSWGETVIQQAARASLLTSPYALLDVSVGRGVGVVASAQRDIIKGAPALDGYSALVGIRLGSDGPRRRAH